MKKKTAKLKARPNAEDEPTTATAPDGPEPHPLPGEFKVVPHGQVRPDPNQPRKTFDEVKLQELAESIRDRGIICPIVVREMAAKLKIEEPNLIHDDWQVIDNAGAVVFSGAEDAVKGFAGRDAEMFYQIVFGERRWRAAKLAGSKEVPVIIRELTEREVFVHQFIENQARENLTHLEEAKAFGEQIARRKETEPEFSPERLAAELGIGRGTVYNRLVLIRLGPSVLEALQAGKIHTSVAALIAMIPDPAKQEKLLKEITNEDDWQFPYSFRDVEEKIEEEYCKQLKDAPFDLKTVTFTGAQQIRGVWHLNDVKLGDDIEFASCADCRHRTGNMKESFPSIKNVNVCTKPCCYQAKCVAHFQEEAAAAKKKGQAVMTPAEFRKVKKDYVDGDKRVNTENRWGDWKQLMGKKAPDPVLVPTDEGLKKFYPKEEATKAAQSNGVKFHGTEADSAKQREKEKEVEKLREARERLAEGLIEKLGDGIKKLKDSEAWKLMARFTDIKADSYWKPGAALLKSVSKERDKLIAKILEDEITRGIVNWDTGAWEKDSLALWNELGVDLVEEEKNAAPKPELALKKAEPQQKDLLTVKKNKKKRGGGKSDGGETGA